MSGIFNHEGVNFQGRRGVQAADCVNDLDVVNFRSLRHYINAATGATIESFRFSIGNVGQGFPVYFGQTGSTYFWRTLSAGTNMSMYCGATITFNTASAVTFSSLSAQSISASTYFSANTPLDQIFINNLQNIGVGPAYFYSGKSNGIAYIRSLSAETPNLFITTGDTNGIHLNPFLVIDGLTANTITATTIDALYYFSAGTPLNFLSSGGLTAVVNTGRTHGIYAYNSGNIAILKSLSGSPNISIYSSSTENSVRLNDDISINGLTANTITATTIDALYYFSAGTPLNFLSSGGLTSVVNTGATHGIYAYTVGNTAVLKSLSGSPNISIYSSSTENSIRLNDNINIVGLSATTISGQSISASTYVSGTTPLDQVFINNLQNIGVGLGFVYSGKSNGIAYIRSFSGGNAIELITGDTIQISHTLWTSGQSGNKSIQVLNAGSNTTANFALTAGKTNTNQSNYATIAGGSLNVISGGSTYSFIGGGRLNYITGSTQGNIGGGLSNALINSLRASVVGGTLNTAVTSNDSIIGAGSTNLISGGTLSAIVAGASNKVYSVRSIVGAGLSNKTYGAYSGVFVGNSNKSFGTNSAILAGKTNESHGIYSSVAGGYNNKTYLTYSFIGGGKNNFVSGSTSSIVGGQSNSVTKAFGFVGGGFSHYNNSYRGAIVGGFSHTAITSANIFIGGGSSHYITGNTSSAVGGLSNRVLEVYSFVGGGTTNTISGGSVNAIIGGSINVIDTGVRSAILGGLRNKNYGTVSAIISGSYNILKGTNNAIIGGKSNIMSASSSYSSIGSGSRNTGTTSNSFIAGGTINLMVGSSSFLGAGIYNSVYSVRSFLGAGVGNINSALASSIVGGSYNITRIGNNQFIGGGIHNKAYNTASVIAGGKYNYTNFQAAQSTCAAILGGAFNSAMTNYSIVVAGSTNFVSGATSIIGGGSRNNILNGNIASGIFAGKYNAVKDTANHTTILGGLRNSAHTSYSVIVGGRNNVISAGTTSSILAGSYHKLYGTRSAIIGGISGILSMNDCVQVPRLRITNTPAGGTYSLSVDSSGYVYRSSLAGVGEANTASNIGGDHGIFASKVGVDLRFKSLSAGTNITMTSSANEITINSTAAAGTFSTNDNGLNTYTGGTSNFQSINVSALTIDHLTVSGATILNTLTAVTVSATTFYSGSTDLSLLLNNYWTSGNLGTESIKTVGGTNYVNGNRSLAAGNLNSVTGNYSAIINGRSNIILTQYSSIVGGRLNIISGGNAFYSFIGGGSSNKISYDSSRSVIVGGVLNRIGSLINNTIYSRYGFVGGGNLNIIGNNIRSWHSFIGGGNANTIDGYRSVLVGGKGNVITGSTIYTSGTGSALVGGRENTIRGEYSFLGGGGGNLYSVSYGNFINGNLSVLVGGKLNIISGSTSFIGGGQGNKIYASFNTIGGGVDNFVSNTSITSTIAGGYKNRTYGTGTFNGGGSYNYILAASDNSSIIGGLRNNIIGKQAFIGGGYSNTINSSNFNYPYSYSSVLIGKLNTISSTYSFVSNGVRNVIYSGGTLNAIINSNNSNINYNLTGITIISLTGFTANRNHTVYVPDLTVINLSGNTNRIVSADMNGLLITQPFSAITSGITTTIIRNGINTFTGGTTGDYTVNITGASLANLIVSGNTTLQGLTATTETVLSLSGTSTRMVVADANGVLSTQSIPSGLTVYDISGFRKSGTTVTGHTIERWFNSQSVAGGTVTTNPLSSRIYAVPLVLVKDTTIDRIAFEVTTTGGTTSNCILGIYNSTDNSTPGDLIFGGTSSFTAATTTTGIKAFSATTTMTAGLYWLSFGMQTQGTLFIRGLSSTAGIPNIVGYNPSSLSAPGLCYVHPYTFNNTLPATFPMSGVSASIVAPAIYIRISNETPAGESLGTGNPIINFRAGTVESASFAGSPQKATITFSSSFSNANYAINITGQDDRSWTYESKTNSSFVINSNSNTSITGNTDWICMAYN